jgi:hypothetical protein
MGKGKAPVKIKFGEEPPPARRDYRWRDIAEALRKRPGEWALVHTDLPASTPWSINKGRVKPVHPDRGFRTRTVGNRRVGENQTRMTAELHMVYQPELDLSLAKRNGDKK